MFVVVSYCNMVVVWDCGDFDDLVVLYCGFMCDNNFCFDSMFEKLVRLKFVFDFVYGMLMVGNLMLLIDGVLVVFFVLEEWVSVCGLLILVYLCVGEIVVVDFVDGDEGLLMVLVYVVLWMFDKFGIVL